MPFSVHIDDSDIFPVIHLRDEAEKNEAVIYTFGALLNAFIVNGHNVIDGFISCADAKENITKGFKSGKLSPFVCRIPAGNYVFKQHSYKTGKFFLGEEAIHGLLYDAIFKRKDSGSDDNSAFVSLRYDYAKKDEGFPFTYSCTVTYLLEKNNSISITTEIQNTSSEEMPLSDGWHPYFKLGASINDSRFQMNADRMLEFDERLVPTRKLISFEKFQKPELMGDTFLDNCFVLQNHTEPACIVKDDHNKLQLTIWADESYPYLQIYTPPHRKSIAIENLSSAPDAFNNGIGLVVLQPQQLHRFKTVYQVAVLK